MFDEERKGGLINGKRIDSLDKMPATRIYLPVDTASPCYRLDKISASLSNLRHQSNARIRAVQLCFAVVEKRKASGKARFARSSPKSREQRVSCETRCLASPGLRIHRHSARDFVSTLKLFRLQPEGWVPASAGDLRWSLNSWTCSLRATLDVSFGPRDRLSNRSAETAIRGQILVTDKFHNRLHSGDDNRERRW